jgi:hypothetical protein
MKIRILIAASACFVIITGFLAVVPGNAQVEFELWEGLWFKGTIKDKGFIGDGSGIDKAVDKIPMYGYIAEWNESAETFTAWLVEFDDESGLWIGPLRYTVKVIGGTYLNWVAYGFLAPGEQLGVELLALILNVKGKEKNGVITNVTAKSVAGCVIYDLGSEVYYSANESMSGKGVPVNKVPDEVLSVMAGILPP